MVVWGARAHFYNLTATPLQVPPQIQMNGFKQEQKKRLLDFEAGSRAVTQKSLHSQITFQVKVQVSNRFMLRGFIYLFV